MGLQATMLLAIRVAEAEYERVGVPLVITSVNDSKHSDRSLHYEGRAVDLRTRHLPEYEKRPIFEALRATLGPVGFDVVWEDPKGPNQHYHIEYQPKPKAPAQLSLAA